MVGQGGVKSHTCFRINLTQGTDTDNGYDNDSITGDVMWQENMVEHVFNLIYYSFIKQF